MYNRGITLFFLIFSILIGFQSLAQQRKTRDTLKTKALKEVVITGYKNPSSADATKISRKELQLVKSNTIGETLSHIPGIQNSSFGPNSGAPMIRSFSGNRVKVLSDGLSLNDLSGISPNLNVMTDMDNLLGIDIYKGDASILFGGKAIGGAVNLLDNTIPKQRQEKNLTGFVTASGGTNAGFNQAFDLNGNLGKHWTWHAGAMNQWIKKIRIPGNTKAPIAHDPKIDITIENMAQVIVDRENVPNWTLYPYISQFVLNNINDPEWGLSQGDLYTFQPNSIIDGVSVPNPKNSVYIPGQPPGTPLSTTVVKGIRDYAPVEKGIMPNSHSDSYAVNLGTSYIGKEIRAGLGYRRSYGYYGIPAFALRKMPGHTDDDGDTHEIDKDATTYHPINTRSSSNSLVMESAYTPKNGALRELRLNYLMQDGNDSELIGDFTANRFSSQRHVARMEIDQRPLGFLKGMSGLDFSFMRMKGSGEQRYLPNNLSREYGIFTLQHLMYKMIELDLGYRHDVVNRRAMPTADYKKSRGLAGGNLSPRDFQLNHFNLGMQLNLNKLAFLKASYVHAERAPDVNELYAGNDHFAIIREENGNDGLNKEIAKTIEFGGGLAFEGFRFMITHYHTNFENFLYMGNTGIYRSGGFAVKEWRQTDTKITGWEADLNYQGKLGSDVKIQMGSYFDLVRLINTSEDGKWAWSNGDYTPNTPTSRFGFSGGCSLKKIEMDVLFDHYLRQRFLGKYEPAMPAYSLLTARVSYKGSIKGIDMDYFINGSNLLNSEARPQNSFLRYIAPLPGINISIGVKVNI